MSEYNNWRNQALHVSKAAHDQIMKARLKPGDVARRAKAFFEDPLNAQYLMGFKDRPYSVSYDFLKRIPQQLSVVAAILQTRCHQVASFSVPYRLSKSIGFQVKHKDPSHSTTKGELEFIKDLETFIYNCGAKKPNPFSEHKRDDFETFLKKLVRDTLTFDAVAFEVVPDRCGVPYEFLPVDASTIRFASESWVPDQLSPLLTGHDRFFDQNGVYREPPPYSDKVLEQIKTGRFGGPANRAMNMTVGPGERPAYIQMLNGQPYNVFTEDELVFGVRNPRNDIYVNGYGYSELEMLVTTITGQLNAEAYNRAFFTQNSGGKGVFNIKSADLDEEALEGFRRQWAAQLEGVNGAWRTPIIQVEGGVEFIDLNKTNRDMEFNSWLEYNIKICAAVFLIDPAEINFDLKGGVSQTPLFESSQEWKLKASRDRGLKPLLRFLAKLINKNIVQRIDDHFVFDFVGLDELTEQEKHTLTMEQLTSYKTLNEVRRELDMPDLKYGDVPMSPTYLQAVQMAQNLEQSNVSSSPNLSGQANPGPVQQEDSSQSDGQAQSANQTPQYSDSAMTKSLKVENGSKYLEISLDDWLD